MQFNLIFGRFFLWVCPRCTPKRKGNYFPLVSIFSRFEMSCVWVCMYIIHIMESRHNDSALCIVVFALLSLAPSPLALLFTISQRIFTLFFFFFHFSNASVATTELSLVIWFFMDNIVFFSFSVTHIFSFFSFLPNYLVCAK